MSHHHTEALSYTHTHWAAVSRGRSQQPEDAVRLPWFQPPASCADRCVHGWRVWGWGVRIYDRTEGRRKGGKEGRRRRLWQQEVLKGGLSLLQKNIRVIVSSEFRPSGSSITPSGSRGRTEGRTEGRMEGVWVLAGPQVSLQLHVFNMSAVLRISFSLIRIPFEVSIKSLQNMSDSFSPQTLLPSTCPPLFISNQNRIIKNNKIFWFKCGHLILKDMKGI